MKTENEEEEEWLSVCRFRKWNIFTHHKQQTNSFVRELKTDTYKDAVEVNHNVAPDSDVSFALSEESCQFQLGNEMDYNWCVSL